MGLAIIGVNLVSNTGLVLKEKSFQNPDALIRDFIEYLTVY